MKRWLAFAWIGHVFSNIFGVIIPSANNSDMFPTFSIIFHLVLVNLWRRPYDLDPYFSYLLFSFIVLPGPWPKNRLINWSSNHQKAPSTLASRTTGDFPSIFIMQKSVQAHWLCSDSRSTFHIYLGRQELSWLVGGIAWFSGLLVTPGVMVLPRRMHALWARSNYHTFAACLNLRVQCRVILWNNSWNYPKGRL